MIKNVVLDIGGVLVNFHTVDYFINLGYSEEMAHRLADATIFSPFWEQNDIARLPYEETLGMMKAAAPDLAEEIDRSLTIQKNIVSQRPETKPWIRQLRSMGYRLLVLSNYSLTAQRDCPDVLNFLGTNLGGCGEVGADDVISEGILSCMDHVVKPYPEIYAWLLTRYGLKGSETVFIDDTQKNLDAARFYGIHTILFKSREQVMEELARITEGE